VTLGIKDSKDSKKFFVVYVIVEFPSFKHMEIECNWINFFFVKLKVVDSIYFFIFIFICLFLELRVRVRVMRSHCHILVTSDNMVTVIVTSYRTHERTENSGRIMLYNI